MSNVLKLTKTDAGTTTVSQWKTEAGEWKDSTTITVPERHDRMEEKGRVLDFLHSALCRKMYEGNLTTLSWSDKSSSLKIGGADWN